MEEKLTPEQTETIFQDIADSIHRHNLFYWWEIPLTAFLFGSLFSVFSLTCFLFKNHLAVITISLVFIIIVFFYILIDGYDLIKARIIIHQKYKNRTFPPKP